jgi:hypothetical protein
MTRPPPLRLPEPEHEHRWADTGHTETVGGVLMAISTCLRRGCLMRRAVRVEPLAASGEEASG